MRRLLCLFVLIEALGLLLGGRALAGDCCARCGCSCNLKKVCRAIPDVKEVTHTCWDVKCEDFCVPGPSKKCGVVHECDECGSWCRTIWQPTCACVRTRRVPVKKEVKRKIPTVKWVVETVCADCCRACAGTYVELTPGQQLLARLDSLSWPPGQQAPVADAKPTKPPISSPPAGVQHEPPRPGRAGTSRLASSWFTGSGGSEPAGKTASVRR